MCPPAAAPAWSSWPAGRCPAWSRSNRAPPSPPPSRGDRRPGTAYPRPEVRQMAETLRGSYDRWLARLSWTLRGQGNPLRRPVDRTEGRLVAGLLVIFLITSPLVAVLAAHLAYGAS